MYELPTLVGTTVEGTVLAVYSGSASFLKAFSRSALLYVSAGSSDRNGSKLGSWNSVCIAFLFATKSM